MNKKCTAVNEHIRVNSIRVRSCRESLTGVDVDNLKITVAIRDTVGSIPRLWFHNLGFQIVVCREKCVWGWDICMCVCVCPYKWIAPSMRASVTLFDRRDTRPPHRAQNFVWQYEQRWPQPSANLVLWHIPQVGASLFSSWVGFVSSPIFLTWSLYDSNCWCNFL